MLSMSEQVMKAINATKKTRPPTRDSEFFTTFRRKHSIFGVNLTCKCICIEVWNSTEKKTLIKQAKIGYGGTISLLMLNKDV